MQIVIRIERYADQGRCIGHVEGRVVFVRFALPGELVRVELDEPRNREDRFWTGEVVEVLEADPDRVTPVWTLAGPLAQGGGLGGADLIHVSAERQLVWKSAIVSEQMRRLGHLDVSEVPVERAPGDDALRGLHWRTRIELIADEEGKPSMRRRGSHVRVPVDTMPLATLALLAVADAQHVWDGGYAPGSQIRVAVPEPRDVDAATASTQELLDAVGENFSVVVNGEVARGTPLLQERVTPLPHPEGVVAGANAGGLSYKVDAGGFWQVHRQAPIVLTEHVVALARQELEGARSAVLWDLYSGSGLFTLPLATQTAESVRMLCVEGGRTAVRNAIRNLRALGLRDADVRCGDVATVLGSGRLPNDLRHPEVIVLDPPRAGARANVCRQMAQSGARSIIYVACDPASLARDSATLVSLGYRLADIRAFDIYPMTHHVETVALFRVEHPIESQIPKRRGGERS